MPAGAGVVVLSLIATTALPFNIFLASSMADGYTLGSMRRGIAFSTFMAALGAKVISTIAICVTKRWQTQASPQVRSTFGMEQMAIRLPIRT